ncbi:MAG: DNA polymerase/3'-5' exonuclease PolX [Sedimentisphaerales bacterium]|nr:DNA polymerase/3'-5' exonuclease PolX [Sedimentisphaerales bacterium]
MSNYRLAQIFDSIADIQEILQHDSVEIEANRRVASIISDSVEDFAVLHEYGQLQDIPGIESSTAEKIREFYQTGNIQQYEQLLSEIPHGLLQLLRVNGLGARSVGQIWRELGGSDLNALLVAANDGRLERLDGFGKKKARHLAANAEFLLEAGNRMPLGRAIEIYEQLRSVLIASSKVKRIWPVGSLRRCCETVGDIDILAVTDNTATLLDYVAGMASVAQVHKKNSESISFTWHDPQSVYKPCEVEIFVVTDDSEMPALCFLTPGSQQREYLLSAAEKKKLQFGIAGLFKGSKTMKADTEATVYKKLGLPYILPTMQDDSQAQILAVSGKLPRVVQVADIRGDLHMHTPDSDGRSTLEELVKAAIARGYDYICITDHSRSSAIAHGLSVERLLNQVEKIRQYNSQVHDIEILCGCEVDILSDGSLDYDDDILAQLDYVAASIHSGMEGDKKINTRRMLAAMDNQYVRCISHPTGRYIKYRRPMELEMEEIFRHAARTNTALEVSSQPARLDLCSEHIRRAIGAGVKLAINTDSHDRNNLSLISLGVAIAQKGYARPEDIINCQPLKKFSKWLVKK